MADDPFESWGKAPEKEGIEDQLGESTSLHRTSEALNEKHDEYVREHKHRHFPWLAFLIGIGLVIAVSFTVTVVIPWYDGMQNAPSDSDQNNIAMKYLSDVIPSLIPLLFVLIFIFMLLSIITRIGRC